MGSFWEFGAERDSDDAEAKVTRANNDHKKMFT